MLLRGCLKSLGLLVLLMAGYAYWFDQRFEERPATFIIGAVAGAVVFVLLMSLASAREAWSHWRLLAGAARDMPLRDGAVVAACGPIHPLGDPLSAPFSGEPCVLCEYDLSQPEPQGKASTGGSDYVGFLMVPSAVRTSLGEVRLLGFPAIDRVPDRRCRGYAAAWNARQFLASHAFDEFTGARLVRAVSAFDVVWADDDGRVEKNMQLGKVSLDELFPPETVEGLQRLAAWEAEQNAAGGQSASDEDDLDDDDEDDEFDDDLSGDEGDDQEQPNREATGLRPPRMKLPKLTEKRVGVGEQVCVIGRYNAERGGLLPSGSKGPVNWLSPGMASELAAGERARVARLVTIGVVGLVVVHAVILVVMAAQG